jgi:hypothetical protein
LTPITPWLIAYSNSSKNPSRLRASAPLPIKTSLANSIPSLLIATMLPFAASVIKSKFSAIKSVEIIKSSETPIKSCKISLTSTIASA